MLLFSEKTDGLFDPIERTLLEDVFLDQPVREPLEAGAGTACAEGRSIGVLRGGLGLELTEVRVIEREIRGEIVDDLDDSRLLTGVKYAQLRTALRGAAVGVFCE